MCSIFVFYFPQYSTKIIYRILTIALKVYTGLYRQNTNKNSMKVHNKNKALLCKMRNYYTNEHPEVCLNLLIRSCGLQASHESSMFSISSFTQSIKLIPSFYRHIQKNVSIFICTTATCFHNISNATLSISSNLWSAT